MHQNYDWYGRILRASRFLTEQSAYTAGLDLRACGFKAFANPRKVDMSERGLMLATFIVYDGKTGEMG